MQTKPIAPELLAQILSDKFQQKFWSKVDQRGLDECWPWKSKVLRCGYGQVNFGRRNGRRTFAAHKIAWIIHNRIDTPDGLFVLHSCIDNRPCCNPFHLRIGTQQENVDDMVRQGRARGPGFRGEKNGLSKLTEQAVIEMRKIHSQGGITFAALGKMFGIGSSGAFSVVRRETWTHI